MGTTGLYAQVVKRVGRTTLPMNNRAGDDSDFYDKGSDDVFSFCWFSYDYPSTSGDGQPTTLSAIACMPDGNGEGTVINNVIAGCHITITSNKECPTEYNTSGSSFSDLYFTMLMAEQRFGDMVKFFPSPMNGGHVDTGMEFFLNPQRLEGIRQLAAMADDGVVSVQAAKAHPDRWYDVFGRPVVKPLSKGVYIREGKKILVK